MKRVRRSTKNKEKKEKPGKKSPWSINSFTGLIELERVYPLRTCNKSKKIALFHSFKLNFCMIYNIHKFKTILYGYILYQFNFT